MPGLSTHLCRLVTAHPLCRLVPPGSCPFLSGRSRVVDCFHDEAADADLAEVVDHAPELVDGVIEVVGVLVQQCQHQLFAALAVAHPDEGGWPLMRSKAASAALGCEKSAAGTVP
jgi:hypothetical protein